MIFLLRPWLDFDAEQLVRAANNAKISAFMTDSFPFPYTAENANKFIDSVKFETPTKVFAILVDGKISGSIGLHPQTDVLRKNAEIGYWLAEEHWGKGIVTEAVSELVDYAFDTFDFNRLFARVFSGNKASEKVLIKNGFSLEATFKNTILKNNVYLDELIYSLRRPD